MAAETATMKQAAQGLSAGARAPDVSVLEPAAEGGIEVGDEPTVVAFFAGPNVEGEDNNLFSSEGERESIRAELRGLGAVLVALSPRCLWCFRPDDEAQLLRRVPELSAGGLAEAFASYGVAPDGPGRGGLSALFVIDGKRTVRFAHVVSAGETVTLAVAMAAAGRANLSPPATSLPSFRTGASRREFLVMSLIVGFAAAVADGCARPPPLRDSGSFLREEVDLALEINGQTRRLRVEPRVSLLDALREQLSLTGTKKGCDHGQCGACTVLVDGRRINSCLTLAVMAEGSKITTIEGLATADGLHPMQAAFIAEDALQCGYCTPGQIMSAVGLIAEGQAHDDDDVRELMSGNICRCGAYPNIVTAIRRVQRVQKDRA